MNRRAAGLAVGFAIVIAAYTGVRLPDRWAVTLQAVSIFDGIHRRFLVGTLLHPLALATSYSYTLFAAFSACILATVLFVIWRAAVRSDSWSRPLIAIAWFLLPTGGFLFNEIGWLEQVVYLLLALAIWLAVRGRIRTAAIVLALTPCVHELAILTAVPLFVAIMVRTWTPRRVVAVVLPAVVVAAIVLLLPPASPATIAQLQASWDRTALPYRADELQLFVRSQAESWELYSFSAALRLVLPATILAVGALGLAWWDRPWRPDAPAEQRQLVLATQLGAVVAPLLLIYGGWDVNRWQLFTIANFLVILWLNLECEPGPRTIAILVIAGLLFARRPIGFIEGRPRELEPREVATFVTNLDTLFEIPSQ